MNLALLELWWKRLGRVLALLSYSIQRVSLNSMIWISSNTFRTYAKLGRNRVSGSNLEVYSQLLQRNPVSVQDAQTTRGTFLLEDFLSKKFG
jgi:hypothetical protein